MSTDLVVLAILMAAVTYPARAMGLFLPVERLPGRALEYLRLVGPAVLAALAAASVLLARDEVDRPTVSVGIEVLAVVVAIAVVARTRSLFAGIAIAVVTVALARATGLG